MDTFWIYPAYKHTGIRNIWTTNIINNDFKKKINPLDHGYKHLTLKDLIENKFHDYLFKTYIKEFLEGGPS